jgi:hypothetical protein
VPVRTTDRLEDLAAWLVVLLGGGVVVLAVVVGTRARDAVPEPGAAGATFAAWAWGGAVALAGWAALGLAWLGLRALTSRRNARAWERDWARVEPRWSGRR